MSEPAVGPEDVSWREVRRVVEEELAELPDDLRAPLVLCLFQGQTQDEAARDLGVNPRTIKDRLHRGRELLRARLTRRGVSLSVLGVLLAGGATHAAVPAALGQSTAHAAAALASHAPLTGLVSPNVLALTGAPPTAAGWVAAVVLALLTLGGGVYVALHKPAPPDPAPGAARPAMTTIHRSFRGRQLDTRLFLWTGPTPAKYVRREDEGLRITLPATKGPGRPVGIALRPVVRGDFELDVTCEVLGVGRPPVWTAGVTAYVFMETPTRDGLWLGKMTDRALGPVFHVGQRVTRGDARGNKFVKAVPTRPEAGVARLRVTRTGSVFTFLAGEGVAGELRPLESVDAGADDLRVVRLAADPAEAADVAIDVRLIDFTMSAREFVGHAPNAP